MEGIEDIDRQAELRAGLEAAEKAGNILDSYFEGDFENWEKDDGSRLTEADVEAQEKIIEILSRRFPEDGFLGEENEIEPEGEERVWIIDPLDGTFNFSKSFPYFCTSIALEVEGELKVAVVHSPASAQDKTFLAVRGEGAYLLDHEDQTEKLSRLEVSEQEEIDGSLFIGTLFEIYEGESRKEAEMLKNFASKGAAMHQVGAGALEMSMLATGKIDFAVIPIVKRWDYAAAKLIIEEAGGEVRVKDSCFPNSFEVVASNGELQEEVEDVVGDRFH